jgi:ketopantoate reductase PanE/ApbA-like protein
MSLGVALGRPEWELENVVLLVDVIGRFQWPSVTGSRWADVRFIIMGAGAIGGVIGARLAQNGHDVTLVARGDHLAVIQDRGLCLVSREGEVTLSLPATDDPTTLDIGGNDVVILAVKGQDTEFALRALANSAPSDVAVFQWDVNHRSTSGIVIVIDAWWRDHSMYPGMTTRRSQILHLCGFPHGAIDVDDAGLDRGDGGPWNETSISMTPFEEDLENPRTLNARTVESQPFPQRTLPNDEALDPQRRAEGAENRTVLDNAHVVDLAPRPPIEIDDPRTQ